MARDSRPARLRRVLLIRRIGWGLIAALTLFGILLGAQQVTRAVDLTGQTLAQAARLMLDVDWLLLLLAATSLAIGLALSGPRGRTVVRWVQARLTTRPVRWTAAALAVLVLLVLVVVVLPPRFTVHRQFDKPSEELKAQNDVRTTLLQALAGGVLLLGAYFTWRQLRVTREGQVTDRYTKAVDQLGSEHLDVRVGGIYALQRIARDSPDDRATIEEVLTAFVRVHAPWSVPPSIPSLQAIIQLLVAFAQRRHLALRRQAAKRTDEPDLQRPNGPGGAEAQGPPADMQAAEPQGPRADVQAAVTVLGHPLMPPAGAPVRPLDLAGVDLRNAWLREANLKGARLTGANLQGARLENAHLRNAFLREADLQNAVLLGADLRDAWLPDSNLQGAQLNNAFLQGAQLYGANL